MTINEFRNSKEYAGMLEKIKDYSLGFKFTIHYYKMSQAQKNGMKILLHDCQKLNLIKSVSISLDLKGEQTEETFIKI